MLNSITILLYYLHMKRKFLKLKLTSSLVDFLKLYLDSSHCYSNSFLHGTIQGIIWTKKKNFPPLYQLSMPKIFTYILNLQFKNQNQIYVCFSCLDVFSQCLVLPATWEKCEQIFWKKFFKNLNEWKCVLIGFLKLLKYFKK